MHSSEDGCCSSQCTSYLGFRTLRPPILRVILALPNPVLPKVSQNTHFEGPQPQKHPKTPQKQAILRVILGVSCAGWPKQVHRGSVQSKGLSIGHTRTWDLNTLQKGVQNTPKRGLKRGSKTGHQTVQNTPFSRYFRGQYPQNRPF